MSRYVREEAEAAYQSIRQELLGQRLPAGYWVGELSASALSTATAVSTFSLVIKHDRSQQTRLSPLVDGGVAWLVRQQNDDGGWGDTDRSDSNISTTMLVLAAIELAGRDGIVDSGEHASLVEDGRNYVDRQGGIAAVRARYGKDKTFAVPILTNAALAGQVAWREVSALPYELAIFPQAWYNRLQLPVVSYAIPALVAIGQAVYFHRKPWNPLMRLIRHLAIAPSMRVLERIQPASGGYLEAIPLTSFVTMSLAATGRVQHPVSKRGIDFLVESVRSDGSWPIDTNLATWVTTLAINGLDDGDDWDRQSCWDWLLSCQNVDKHPFTGAAPGGWGWSDLSGAVPDADDTPGALLALRRFYESADKVTGGPNVQERKERTSVAARNGIGWLIDLQNRDGGWPTFCRGWGKLPFDRSGTDLTAHVLRAFFAWQDLDEAGAWQASIDRGWKYLAKTQYSDGSWSPLWFGNQSHEYEDNPVYGTSKVLLAYRDGGRMNDPAAIAGINFLVKSQEPSGRWGVKSADESGTSLEETALAVEALCGARKVSTLAQPVKQALDAGVNALISAIRHAEHRKASPIGLYFAKLWYYEKLYPMTFAVSALRHVLDDTIRFPVNDAPSSLSQDETKTTLQ